MLNTIDIKKLSIEQLKALAYDEIVMLELAQKNLKAINEEIRLRSQEKVEEKKK